jgi:hypothetical protein
VSKLPRPPSRLSVIAPDITLVPAGTLLWRIYRAGGSHPVSWNSFRTYGPVAIGRFDHHQQPARDQPDRGIYNAADDAATAIVEAFQDTRVVDCGAHEPWLVAFALDRDLSALDLTGAWPTRVGASQAIAAGRRDVARAWSRAIWVAYPGVAALRYRSSMAGGAVNTALYERAERLLPLQPTLNLPLSHPGLTPDLNRIADRYGYGLR